MSHRDALLRLAARDIELLLTPERGGGVAAFRWRGIDVMRPALPGDSPLGLASFPLVPFSNRIAQGRFTADERQLALTPNLPGIDQPHAIHGFGWQSPWSVTERSPTQVRLVHHYEGAEWPWPYRAEQHFRLEDGGFWHGLSLRNDGGTPMPAGLGLHPYFPRAGRTLDLKIDGRWDVDDTCLPTGWTALAQQPDWLGSGPMDHVFTGRSGPISLRWPGRRLIIRPADDLRFSVVYAPVGADYFCVEPVSHLTDAVNRPEDAAVTGLRWLDPGATWSTSVRFAMSLA
ncbi:MAG: aldose 1-epimerase [Sphingopyxis sp.]|nr:aldose 1-epimerase [Sphingopyxis sp.]